ncbi:hypothetical protein ABH894_000832 [Paenibacillus sp. RC62]
MSIYVHFQFYPSCSELTFNQQYPPAKVSVLLLLFCLSTPMLVIKLDTMVVVKDLIRHIRDKQKASCGDQKEHFFQHCLTTPFQ